MPEPIVKRIVGAILKEINATPEETNTTTRKIKGKVLRSNDNAPYRDTKIEIWDRDFLLDDQVGTAITDDNGSFNLKYDPADAGQSPDLTIKVFRLNAAGELELIHEQDGNSSDLNRGRDVTGDYDFGIVEIFDWEYDEEYKVPLIRTLGFGINASPQDFVAPQTSKILVNGLRFGALQRIGDNQPDIPGVQQVFPANLTLRDPNSDSDEFFIDAALNRFSPAMFIEDENGKFHVRYGIDQYDWDGIHQSPKVDLVLEKGVDSKLFPLEISWSIRDRNVNTIDSNGNASPNDQGWEKAKEYFRIAEFIDGQVKGHLGRGHLNVGQYALSLYRNIQKNPILKLLHPHLKGVTAINSFGKEIIFGEQGVLALSPLTQDSLIDALEHDLGSCNWEGWSPRKSINNQHSYAEINKLYWDIVNEYVDEFFLTHKEKIILDWKEIYYFSKDLVKHSVPFKPLDTQNGEQFYCLNEISVKPGNGMAISDITEKKVISDLEEPDKLKELNRLKQVCAYAIYHATIWHDWRNDYQDDYGGEIAYARLALDYEPKEASFQLFIVNILNSVKHGFIVKNEEGDIPELFIVKLKSRIKDFEKYKYDLRDLRSRINI